MPEEPIDGVKFSEFPSAVPGSSDELVGLHSGNNARFSVSKFILSIRQGLANLFVPQSRTINGKGLSSDIALTAQDVGARPNTWTPSAADVGAIPATAKGAPLGVAELDSNGQVPASQLDLSGKQAKITASGILKGDGQGGVSAAIAGTDYQAPLTAGTDYATPAQLADKANQAQLAIVESGSTASRAYTVGEYFCWNGLLYRATASISVGQSFTPGTNCEAVTAGGELLNRCRTMTVVVTKGKSIDIVITGNNYTPSHGFILLSTGNQPTRMMGAWLCFGLGIRYNYRVIQPLHTSGATSLSLTSTVNGKYTFTNSDAEYDCAITVAVLQETGTVGSYLSLSAPY